eukprot:CAMPEP_0197933940 /NCGR_PEP_ID=MMETSP1439-20131203/110943_1 /TAXON_ID=66791 /ORGANISM="Gonyaulax spinifera, Strain CCMP409" /LENGTH=590 /DNA_ID=CAMNT_0043556797 /DNA_START=52 /DNA_END=1824 /DNA_ORIENTATION=+
MSARAKLRDELAEEEELEEETEEFDEDSDSELEKLHPAQAHIAGTHGVRHGRTHTSSSSCLKGKVLLGLTLQQCTFLALWLLFIAVALFKSPSRALPLALFTAVCLTGYVLTETGLLAKIRKGLPMVPRAVHVGILGTLVAFMVGIIVFKISHRDGRESGVQVLRAQALLGTCVLVAACVLLSWNRRGIPWLQVISAILLQFFLGLFVLTTSIGMAFFKNAGDAVTNFLNLTDVGCSLVFGSAFKEHFFAFKVLPVTIFFSAFISTMYYIGVMQAVVRVIAILLKKLVGTSLIQSVNAAGNLFLGQTEAPLLIKPFLEKASPCDLHCVMVGGFASIAGGVLAAYIGMGVSASQLIGASVMSVPGTLLVSNLVCPPGSMREEEVKGDAADSESDGEDNDHFEFPPIAENNVIEAAGNGAHMAIDLVLNIGAMLIAFATLIAAMDELLGYLGHLVDISNLSFGLICSYVFYPLAWLIGAPLEDCLVIGKLIGTKIFVNEFVAYDELSKLVADEDGNALDADARGISQRGELTATYALCGFSNIGSIGIQLGCLSSLCPARSKSFAKLVVSAMVSGNVVCFLTATFATLLSPA